MLAGGCYPLAAGPACTNLCCYCGSSTWHAVAAHTVLLGPPAAQAESVGVCSPEGKLSRVVALG